MLMETFLFVLGQQAEIQRFFGVSNDNANNEEVKTKEGEMNENVDEKSCSICGCSAGWKVSFLKH